MQARRTLALALGLVLLATMFVVPSAQAASGAGSYIVVLKDSVARPAVVATQHKKKHDVKVKRIYTRALKGYAARIKGAELAALRKDPLVAFVEKDRVASISKRGGRKPPPPPTEPYTFPSWGLDRIDQEDLPLDSTFDPNGNGAGVTVYVIDTGLYSAHAEFGGRASLAMDWVGGSNPGGDCHGHGTHVAGTIGGSTYGVARSATLVGLRVLNCSGSGSWSNIIAAINYVMGQPASKKVINISISGPASNAVELAIKNADSNGVTVVVAAGNESRNACNYSPAGAPEAITVGATTSSDGRASYSNYGTCLDIFAPGSSITSAWIGGSTATRTISGTSMASPHAAGVAALILQDTPGADVEAALRAMASRGNVGGINKRRFRGTPNLLLWATGP